MTTVPIPVPAPGDGTATVALIYKSQFGFPMPAVPGGAVTFDTAGVFIAEPSADGSSVTFTATAATGSANATYTNGSLSDLIPLVVQAAVASSVSAGVVTYTDAAHAGTP